MPPLETMLVFAVYMGFKESIDYEELSWEEDTKPFLLADWEITFNRFDFDNL